MDNKMLHMITFGLMAIGGLNWLLYGAFGMNLVANIFGSGTVAMVIYILVGVATIIEIINHKKCCTKCQ